MSVVKRPNILYQDKLLDGATAAAAVAATTTFPCLTMDGDYRLEKFEVVAPGGYTADPTNYYIVTAQARLQTFTGAVTGICTAAAHGFVQGQSVTLTTSSALPSGLAINTTYYVILLTVNTFKLATTYANANAGTAVALADTGTGTQSIAVLLASYSLLTGAQGSLVTNVFGMGVLATDPVGLRNDQINVVLTKVGTAANFPANSVFNLHLKQVTAS